MNTRIAGMVMVGVVVIICEVIFFQLHHEPKIEAFDNRPYCVTSAWYVQSGCSLREGERTLQVMKAQQPVMDQMTSHACGINVACLKNLIAQEQQIEKDFPTDNSPIYDTRTIEQRTKRCDTK